MTGRTATFSVSAVGVTPLKNDQVDFDGNALTNQTNSALLVTNAGASSQGDYSVKLDERVRLCHE